MSLKPCVQALSCPWMTLQGRVYTATCRRCFLRIFQQVTVLYLTGFVQHTIPRQEHSGQGGAQCSPRFGQFPCSLGSLEALPVASCVAWLNWALVEACGRMAVSPWERCCDTTSHVDVTLSFGLLWFGFRLFVLWFWFVSVCSQLSLPLFLPPAHIDMKEGRNPEMALCWCTLFSSVGHFLFTLPYIDLSY